MAYVLLRLRAFEMRILQLRSKLIVLAAASTLGLGWMHGRTPEAFSVSNPVLRAALGPIVEEPARPNPGPGATVAVKVDGSKASGRVDDRFLSVALDTSQVLGGRWWDRAAQDVALGRGGEHARPFDFDRPGLRTLAAALAPAYLRVGGTEADVVYYDMGETPRAEAPKPYELVLTRDRWDAMQSFAHDAGYDLVFTVNAGTGPRDASGRWSPDNAQSLLEYTRAAGYRVPVWELGNEVDAYWATQGPLHQVSARQYADDLALFGGRVRAAMPGAKVAGPGAFYAPVLGEAASVFSDFMGDYLKAGAGGADIVTWHFYPQQSRRCAVATRRASPTRLLDPLALDEAARWSDRVARQAAAFAPGAETWLDETGNAQCGGEPGVSDRFVGSLWWVDELGLAARHGQRVVVRQTLAGSNYGLVDDDHLAPNPDYWASVLWKRLMGTTVLGVQASGEDAYVRAYAQCTPGQSGSVSLVAVNLHPDRPARIRVDGADAHGARLYRMTAPSLTGTEADLNGKALRFDGDLPPIEPAEDGAPGGFVELPAASYAFVVLPEAAAPACLAANVTR